MKHKRETYKIVSLFSLDIVIIDIGVKFNIIRVKEKGGKMNTIEYKGSLYHFQYREDVLKHHHWFENDKGKWICRVIREKKRGRKRKEMKKYSVEDLQECNFMDDTWKEPMTANGLRSRFWSLDDKRNFWTRTNYYKDFTLEYIEVMWAVKFVEFGTSEWTEKH